MTEYKVYQASVRVSIPTLRIAKEGMAKNPYYDAVMFAHDPADKYSSEETVWVRIWTSDKTTFLTPITKGDLVSVEGFLTIKAQTVNGKRFVNVNISATEIRKQDFKRKPKEDAPVYHENMATHDATPEAKEETPDDDIPF